MNMTWTSHKGHLMGSIQLPSGRAILYTDKEWAHFGTLFDDAVKRGRSLQPGQSAVIGEVTASTGSIRLEALKELRKPSVRFTRITANHGKDSCTLRAEDFSKCKARIDYIAKGIAGH